MMLTRRKFFGVTASFVGASLLPDLHSSNVLSANQQLNSSNKLGKMNLTFSPYPLKLRHAFGVASVTRTETMGVQVQIELDGVVGYGEASMPPYLSESTDSVLSFLNRVDLSNFKSPFEMEDILAYVDSICEHNTAAKASIDLALHDLVGKLMGQPWWKIWGFDKDKTPTTMYTIGIDLSLIHI